MARRFSLWFLLFCLPVTGLTMYARVMLEAHTVSAVFAGGMIGALVALLFTAKRKRKRT
jgi:lipid A 1-phosphatase